MSLYSLIDLKQVELRQGEPAGDGDVVYPQPHRLIPIAMNMDLSDILMGTSEEESYFV